MARFYKEDTLNIRINPILKTKFHIAVGFAGISATLNSFINNFVRDYEKQYGIIPINLDNSLKYDVITKFFGIQLDKQLYKKMDHLGVLKLINEKLGSNMNYEDFESMISKYPKTRRKDCNEEYTTSADFV